MKRILSLILALLLTAAALASCGSETTQTASETSGETALSTGEVPDSGSETSETTETASGTGFTTLVPQTGKVREHKTLEELPAYATLVGSETLPPIDNQGAVGCCASEAITYLQFTNAVAQYKLHNGGLDGWNPSADYKQCFSPKFTYQFAGASTANVYNMLKSTGALKYEIDSFAKVGDASQINIGGKPAQQTLQWVTDEGLGELALRYRITNFEQTFVTNNGLYTASGKSGVAMTTSEAGRAMINKIKEAIATGNVVVTGGYPSAWEAGVRRVTEDGSIAKKGDSVITFSSSDRSGGHQVAIVAYDDDLVVTANGITMKGAFLIANSWGKSYGKNGYIWVMYDALNSESEYEGFKLPGNVGEGLTRDWTLDQFCFIYWDRDIIDTLPDLYAEVQIETADRDAFQIELSRTDANGETKTYTPGMFMFMDMHDKYDQKGYITPAGVVNGEASNGFYTVNYEELCKLLPMGTDYTNYLWGMKISSSSESSPVKVKSIVFKNGKGETVKTLSFGDGEVLTKESRTYKFDFGNELAGNFYNGEYTFKNVATGEYLVKDGVMKLKMGKEKDAVKINVSLDGEKNMYVLFRDDNLYVIDAKEGAKEGTLPMFNKQMEKNAATQTFNFSYNEDGTVSIYLFDEAGKTFAAAAKDGKFVLTEANEPTEETKWTLTATAVQTVDTSVKVTENGLEVSGKLRSAVDTVKITAYASEGVEVTSVESPAKDKTFKATLDVKTAGTYIVKVTNAADGKNVGVAYVVTVK